jgi:uncharacterized protein YyaL (SSP411 family)
LESGKEKYLRLSREIIITGNIKDKSTGEMLRAIYHRFLPRKVLLLHPQGEDRKAIKKIAPFTKEQNKINGKATTYVCKDFACRLPTTDVAEMVSLLESD